MSHELSSCDDSPTPEEDIAKSTAATPDEYDPTATPKPVARPATTPENTLTPESTPTPALTPEATLPSTATPTATPTPEPAPTPTPTTISPPDLVVDAPTVSDSSPMAGQALTLNVTVRNQGDGTSDAAVLTHYRFDRLDRHAR